MPRRDVSRLFTHLSILNVARIHRRLPPPVVQANRNIGVQIPHRRHPGEVGHVVRSLHATPSGNAAVVAGGVIIAAAEIGDGGLDAVAVQSVEATMAAKVIYVHPIIAFFAALC